MKRCSFRAWIPILPLPVWPLAWQCSLGQNTVVGSMTLLLAVRGNIATRSMSGPLFALQLHRSTVWCRAIDEVVFPFDAKVIGEIVQITGMAWPDHGFGLQFTCENNGIIYTIDTNSIEW